MTDPLHILIIDDDEVANFITEEILAELKIADTVHVSLNGSEGLQYLRSLPMGSGITHDYPDLIFLDVNMPVMDGFVFLKEYALLPAPLRTSRIVLMLGSTLTEEDKARSQALMSQVAFYLPKPLNKEVISNLVNTYFN